ncbi:MAG: hypothetical protein JXL97_02915 [Bacteroidales bacterium]|nr:hypothetical protein [Bacteroidales bacterium]
MKKIFKISLTILGIIVGLFAAFLIYAGIDDYKPDEKEVEYASNDPEVLSLDTFSVMLWNIGYCGMDATMDFFYDGGTQPRVSKEQTESNLQDIQDFIVSKADETDFFLLQEVDKKAKRSYKINEYETLNSALPDFKTFFGKNYDVFFIPVPVTKPYGQVTGGLASYTKYESNIVTRFQYPGNYSWPTKLFMLDRCFLENRFKLSNGKELLVINLHNSAFDDGSLRAQQLEYLRTYIDAEYEKGNYLIIGGDWNQSPPNFKPGYLGNFVDDTTTNSYIPVDAFDNGWIYVYSSKIPSNRRSNIVYDKKTTPTTVIDFFLISPNVEPIYVECIDLDFKNTDHQPVMGKFKLK